MRTRAGGMSLGGARATAASRGVSCLGGLLGSRTSRRATCRGSAATVVEDIGAGRVGFEVARPARVRNKGQQGGDEFSLHSNVVVKACAVT